MSKETKQRTKANDIKVGAPDDGGAGVLTDTRVEMDRLFAVAAKSFEAMSEGGYVRADGAVRLVAWRSGAAVVRADSEATVDEVAT